jgi:hypothetical protein
MVCACVAYVFWLAKFEPLRRRKKVSAVASGLVGDGTNNFSERALLLAQARLHNVTTTC